MTHTLPSFEELRDLAERQPEALEALRRELTDAVIARAPPRHRRRLRGLQFQIETRCQLAPSPLAACIWISRQMHNNLESLRQALERPPRPMTDPPRAAVLRFPSGPAVSPTSHPRN